MISPLMELILENRWEDFQPLMDRLHAWTHWPLFLTRLVDLDRSALFESRVHGQGHIERTMLHGAFCAMEEGLDGEDTGLLLYCCAYHDVGRVNDRVDHLHGHRSAARLAGLTGQTGQALTMMMAAVDAHSRPESHLQSTLEGYAPAQWDRCLTLTQLLKDADGLDRVRIYDLDVSHLRRQASRDREGFAEYLFGRYQRLIKAPLNPPFAPALVEKLSDGQRRRDQARRRSPRYEG